MNKQEFLSELKQKLGRLPQAEQQDVIEYYNEYFEDAGIENEQSVLAELGCADSIAKRLNASYVVKNIDSSEQPQTPRRGMRDIFTVVAAVFAAPIALPLALSAVIVAVSLAFAAAAVLLSVLLTCVAGFVCGIALIVVGISVAATSVGTTLLFAGGGLVLISFGVAAGVLVTWLSGLCFNLIAKMMSRILPKNSQDPNMQGGE